MVQSYLRGSSYVIPQRKDAAFFVGSHQKYWENSEGLPFLHYCIDYGDLLLNLKCFKLYLRKLHLIMPCSKGGVLCKMIFKSRQELYEFHLAPSPWSICRFQKKNKWANGLPGGQERVRRGSCMGMLRIDRAMCTIILASVLMAYLI